MKRDFGDYNWSLRTLARRLKELGITYINHETSVDDAKEAVEKKINGPGKLFGYRAMNQKLRTEYSVNVPSHFVHNVMREVDPEGIGDRLVNKKIKKNKQPFTSEGQLRVVSLDSHGELCGYQNSTFRLGVSCKVLYLFLSFSNSEPEVIGKNYLEYLGKSKLLPYFIRVDRGKEIGKMYIIHGFVFDHFSSLDDVLDSVIYCLSTSNKIERFWSNLHYRLENYFKEQLHTLLERDE